MTSDQVVGSLHPDNVDLLPASGSVVELLLIARCHKPTVGSTLFELYRNASEQPLKLFWVMYVVWKDGIAERRGIGQILEEGLVGATGEKPIVKSVFLG